MSAERPPVVGKRSTGASPRGERELRIRLLGGFGIDVDGVEVADGAWRLRRSKTLVKLLALDPARRLHREEIADLLWSELDAAAAANNVRQAIYFARRALGRDGHRVLIARGDVILLSPEAAVTTDAADFEARLARAHGDPVALADALALYTGDLLPEDRYEDWATSKRDALRASYLSGLRELARLEAERGDAAAAIAAIQRAIEADPTNEDAHVALMRLYADAGGRTLALRQYEQLAATLRADLGVAPRDGARARGDRLRRGRRFREHTGAPAREPAGAAHRIRRARARARGAPRAAGRHEAPHAHRARRLRKDRLALELGARVLDAYSDGVWLVELDALSDPDLVHGSVARTVPLPGTAQRSPHALAAVLREREVLLLLDGCEHLLPGVATLVDLLLRSAPRVRVLATSREALGVDGEARYPTPPLPVPESDGLPVDRLLAYAAVRLFVDRARFAAPSFVLDARSAPAVARICRRLDGLPLAIEIAAAQVRSLGVQHIAERLDDRSVSFASASRTGPARHHTLEAVVDWSYERLAPAERRLFERLAVFAGGFDLEAAEAVAADGEIRGRHVLDLVAHLVDKSMVVVEPVASGAVRYRMLETLRGYAHDRLGIAGDAEATARRHAAHFAAVADRAAAALDGPQQAYWLDRLDDEHDNLRAAHADRSADASLGLAIAVALRGFWYARGHLAEGRQWLSRLLALPPSDPDMRARALDAAALLAREQADSSAARTYLEEAALTWRGLGRADELAATLEALGVVARRDGDLERARGSLEESVRIQRERGHEDRTVVALRTLALLASESGDRGSAASFASESLDIERRLGNRRGTAASLNALGIAAHLAGRTDEARARYEEALAESRAAESKPELIWSLSNLGQVAVQQGELGAARDWLAEGLELARDIGDEAAIAGLLLDIATLAIAASDPAGGYRLAAASSRRREQLDHALALRQALVGPALGAARERIGEDHATALWLEGRELSLEAALEHARRALGAIRPGR